MGCQNSRPQPEPPKPEPPKPKPTGIRTWEVAIPRNKAYHLEFSRKCRYAFVLRRNPMAQVRNLVEAWDIVGGRRIFEWSTTAEIFGVASGPREHTMVILTEEHFHPCCLRIINLRTGFAVKTIDLPISEGHPYIGQRGVCCSKDFAFVLTKTNWVTKVRLSDGHCETFIISPINISRIWISLDETMLFTNHSDSTTTVWDLCSGVQIGQVFGRSVANFWPETRLSLHVDNCSTWVFQPEHSDRWSLIRVKMLPLLGTDLCLHEPGIVRWQPLVKISTVPRFVRVTFTGKTAVATVSDANFKILTACVDDPHPRWRVLRWAVSQRGRVHFGPGYGRTQPEPEPAATGSAAAATGSAHGVLSAAAGGLANVPGTPASVRWAD